MLVGADRFGFWWEFFFLDFRQQHFHHVFTWWRKNAGFSPSSYKDTNPMYHGDPTLMTSYKTQLPPKVSNSKHHHIGDSVQFSSVAQSCPTLCDLMNRSTPGLPVHHQLPEFTQTHIHRVSDAIQPSHPLSSPSPPAPNPSQHQSLFQWVKSSHEVPKVLDQL